MLATFVVWVALGLRVPRLRSRKAIDRSPAYIVTVVVVAVALTVVWGERSARSDAGGGLSNPHLLLFVATIGYSSAIKNLEEEGRVAAIGARHGR